jgi:hypothetical protein
MHLLEEIDAHTYTINLIIGLNYKMKTSAKG